MSKKQTKPQMKDLPARKDVKGGVKVLSTKIN